MPPSLDEGVHFHPSLRGTFSRGVDKGAETVVLPAVISFLAPGQEWRTVFNIPTTPAERNDTPMVYEGVVTYEGLDGDPRKSDVIIDLYPYRTRIYTEVFGVHHIAKALRDIRDTHKKWNEDTRGGLKVFSRDGDAKDEEKARRFREYQEERAGEPKPPRRVHRDPTAAASGSEAEPTEK